MLRRTKPDKPKERQVFDAIINDDDQLESGVGVFKSGTAIVFAIACAISAILLSTFFIVRN